MRFVRWVLTRVRNRMELIRVRKSLRGVNDFEAIGRLAGLSLFPITIFLCGGWMTGYSNDRIRDSLKDRCYRISDTPSGSLRDADARFPMDEQGSPFAVPNKRLT